MKTFEHKNKTYTIKNGFVYELDKGLYYTPVEKGSDLELIARNYGFKQNIEDNVNRFHTYSCRKNTKKE